MNNQKLPQCNIVNDTFFSKYCDSIRSNKLSCILSNSLFHPYHGIKKFNQTCQHSDTNIHCWKTIMSIYFQIVFVLENFFFFKFFPILQYLDFKYNNASFNCKNVPKLLKSQDYLRFFSTNTLLTGWLIPVGAANTGCWSGLFLCSSSMISSSSTSSSLEQCISAGRGFLSAQNIQWGRERIGSKM